MTRRLYRAWNLGWPGAGYPDTQLVPFDPDAGASDVPGALAQIIAGRLGTRPTVTEYEPLEADLAARAQRIMDAATVQLEHTVILDLAGQISEQTSARDLFRLIDAAQRESRRRPRPDLTDTQGGPVIDATFHPFVRFDPLRPGGFFLGSDTQSLGRYLYWEDPQGGDTVCFDNGALQALPDPTFAPFARALLLWHETGDPDHARRALDTWNGDVAHTLLLAPT